MTVSAGASILSAPIGDLAELADWWLAGCADAAEAPTAALGSTVRLVSDAVGDHDVMAVAVGATLMSKDAANVMSWQTDPATGAVDYENWMDTCEQARDVAYSLRSHRGDPENIYRLLPAECRQLVDDITQACDDPADRILVSGPFTAVATLLAYEINPDSYRAVRPVSFGASEVESLAWDYLRLSPALPIRTALPATALAPIAVDLVNAAVAYQISEGTHPQTEA